MPCSKNDDGQTDSKEKLIETVQVVITASATSLNDVRSLVELNKEAATTASPALMGATLLQPRRKRVPTKSKNNKDSTTAKQTKRQRPRFQASTFTTDIPWVAAMAIWLQDQKESVSDRNATSILRQVVKLATGQGIGYPSHWPSDVLFYIGRRVDLTYDFDAMMEQAKQYETAFGRDLGHGWLLRHPIKKMKLFQVYCGKVPYRIEAANALTPYTKTEEEMKDDLKG